MLSTAEDLVRFGVAILDGRLLEPDTVEQMFAPQLDPVRRFEEDGPPTIMGFRQAMMWRIRDDEAGRPYVHHCGTLGGFNACLSIWVDDGFVMATAD